MMRSIGYKRDKRKKRKEKVAVAAGGGVFPFVSTSSLGQIISVTIWYAYFFSTKNISFLIILFHTGIIWYLVTVFSLCLLRVFCVYLA